MRADLKAALKAGAREEVASLRALIAAVDNAEAVPLPERPASEPHAFGVGSAEAPRRDLSQHDLSALLAAEIAELKTAAASYAAAGLDAHRTALESEIARIRRYRED